MKYIFLKDFPPTGWKKGEKYIFHPDHNDYIGHISENDLAIMLATKIIKPYEEDKTK